MGRWEPDGRRRLQEAALELYAEQGLATATAAAVAERAGLTERTFFRHFADKKEVRRLAEPPQEALTDLLREGFQALHRFLDVQADGPPGPRTDPRADAHRPARRSEAK